MSNALRFFIGFAISSVFLFALFYRPLSPNEQAILLIDDGRMAETYETLKENCEKAARIAEDEDIIKIADHLARGAMVMIAARDRSQRDKTMSVQDFINTIMAGLDPRIGWEGLRLAAESLLLKDEYERIETKYGAFGYLSGRSRLGAGTILLLSVLSGIIAIAIGRTLSKPNGTQQDGDGQALSPP